MIDTQQRELARIREAYRSYEGRVGSRWSVGNPGNRATRAEYGRLMSLALRAGSSKPLAEQRILEIGCGSGGILSLLREHGASEELLCGVDLIHARSLAAARTLPRASIQTGNAARLPYADACFDAVLLFTVFSSVLDGQMQSNIASEARRVAKAHGSIVVYDFRVPSPFNRATRRLSRSRIVTLFSHMHVMIRTLTVVPLLARRLGKYAATAYPVLGALPALRTHHLALIRSEAPADATELRRAGFVELQHASRDGTA